MLFSHYFLHQTFTEHLLCQEPSEFLGCQEERGCLLKHVNHSPRPTSPEPLEGIDYIFSASVDVVPIWCLLDGKATNGISLLMVGMEMVVVVPVCMAVFRSDATLGGNGGCQGVDAGMTLLVEVPIVLATISILTRIIIL